jgi:hypothetical protein
MGPKTAAFSQLFIGKYGTGTPIHNAQSYNLFYMIDGSKKWYFIDPADQCLAYPFYHNGVPAAFSFCPYPDEYEKETFPLHPYCPYYTATLQPGDILFNPPWWWHAIRNLTEESVAVATRWMTNGVVGGGFLNVEENYDINRFASLIGFFGRYGFQFLHGVLRTPCPKYDEHFTLREKHGRFYSHQNVAAWKPGINKFGYRFTF